MRNLVEVHFFHFVTYRKVRNILRSTSDANMREKCGKTAPSPTDIREEINGMKLRP